MRSPWAWVSAWVCVAAVLAGGAQPAQAGRPTPEAIDRAIARGVAWLWTHHKGDHWDEQPPGSVASEWGGRTALCVYALLSAGQSDQDPRLIRTLAWLRLQEPTGVHARSLRACALSRLPGAGGDAVLRADAEWLISQMGPTGAYGHDRLSRPGPDAWDNDNTQMALQGIWSAAEAGVRVPREYWRRMQAHWLRHQGAGGGWAYTTSAQRPYGSMSAAGLASLYICQDALLDAQADAPAEPPAIARALEWFATHFSARENPGRGPQYFHHYLYALERVGRMGGHKLIAGQDWYALGAAELLRTQAHDGGWGNLTDTAYALLFLARGRHPVLVSKLRYDGEWNSRPRDLARLAGWFGRQFETPANWQVLDADAPLEQWHDAPVLLISGTGLPRFTPEQLQKLRAFALRGGLIVSEAAHNSPVFTAEMRRVYQRLFPEWPVQPIDPSHPVYTAHAPLQRARGLLGVSNGVRLLAVHSPADLSGAWQMAGRGGGADPLQLAANVYFHATDFGTLRRAGDWSWPAHVAGPASRTIRVAVLTPPNLAAPPEPLAYERLATELANEHGIELIVDGPIPIDALPANSHAAALLSGWGDFTLAPEQARALRGFVRAGGLLVADALGGCDAFDLAARRELLSLLDDGQAGRLALASEVYRPAGLEIERVAYRRAARLRLGGSTEPGLQAVLLAGRPAIVYSHEDLTAGLVGYLGHGLYGYAPRSAFELMRNLLLHAADRPAPTPPDPPTGVEVEWRPPPVP